MDPFPHLARFRKLLDEVITVTGLDCLLGQYILLLLIICTLDLGGNVCSQKLELLVNIAELKNDREGGPGDSEAVLAANFTVRIFEQCLLK